MAACPILVGAGVALTSGYIMTRTSGTETTNLGGMKYAPRAAKYYFEMTLTTLAGNYAGLGLNWTPDSGLDESPGSITYYNNGGVYIASTSATVTYSTFTSGDVIQCAVDTNANKVWFGKNNAWNGDPAAGTGGVSPAGTNLQEGLSKPVVRLITASGQVARFRVLAADMVYSIPSGFVAADGESYTISLRGWTVHGFDAPNIASPSSIAKKGFPYGRAMPPFGGLDYIAGVTKIDESGGIIVGNRQVRLYDKATGRMVGETWSHPVTGAYQFLGIDPNRTYEIRASDHTKVYNMARQDHVLPSSNP